MSRLILIGCGKAKGPAKTEAADLYTGNLFKARRAYALMASDRGDLPEVRIVSAKFGAISFHTEIAPYDTTIKDLDRLDRAAWTLGVVQQIIDELADGTDPREVILELHLGADYAEPIRDVAIAVGFKVDWATKGMGIGEQLAWYKSGSRTWGRPR